MLQQSKLAQMGEMISMIAHQWRQPLNNLSMLNQSIKIKYKRDSLDAKTMDYFFENSSKQIAQMSQTIDDFRGFFKPDKEKVEFCIHDVISNCLNIIGPILHQKNIQIDVVDDLTLMLVGYPNELGQVILNLVHNAIDAFEDKKKNDKMIQIYLKRSDDTTIVMIRDNAGGIPHDILPNIFDPYFSTKENKNGTGLGLYMSKLIIEDHMSGKITVENSRDGALFYLSFSNEARVGN
jgi:signal transduction histidine kinase